MKTYFFNTSNVLPVPAVLGGATESLLTFLIEENEKHKLMRFVIHCKYSKEAELLSKNLQYTKIFYHKKFEELSVYNKILNIDVLSFFRYKLGSKIRPTKYPKINRYYYFAYRITCKIKPDYIIAEGGLYEQYEYFLRKFDKSKMYAHLHREVNGNENLWNIFPNAIAISNFIRKEYIASNKSNELNIKLLYNCCDDSKFKATTVEEKKNKIKKELKINNNDFVIVFSGRIINEKGVLELMEAVSLIENSNIKLIVIGSSLFANAPESAYESKVKRIAKESDGRIVTTGFIHNSLLPIYFSIADICVVPSIYEEPLALVPAEAMTSGLPVIITDSGGMVEYQKDDCLIVVKRGEDLVKNIKEAILRLYNNPSDKEELIKRGKKRAEDFTKEKYYFNFYDLFRVEEKNI
jgi:glycosyltransferase involved in cell wall biosynthesis